MKMQIRGINSLFIILLASITACKKDGHPGQDAPPPLDQQASVKVKVRAAIKIGQVLYDSVPAHFKITSWDKSGAPHQKDTLLPAGVSEIAVPNSHTRYKFEMSKWGVSKDTTIEAVDLNKSIVYRVAASKGPKLLKEEISYSYVAGSFRPLTKMDFAYTAGKLSEITFHQIFLTGGVERFEPIKKEEFSYNGNALGKIKEVYLMDLGTEASERTFLYDADGRIAKTNVIYPTGNFAYRNEYSLTGDQVVNIFLEGVSNPAGTRYRLQFENGNRTEIKTITNSDTYGYSYQYDLNINPYVHMNWPDTWFYRQSKNNISVEKFFLGGQISEDTKYEYRFDNEGYPIEIIQKERDPATNNFLIRSKKVFTY
jgi:hypothetical protein